MLHDFTGDKFDIILQAGQSNAEGYGFGETENPYCPTDSIWEMDGDTVSVAREKVTGNEIQTSFLYPFAREYADAGLLGEGRKLLLLRTAVGGTGFLDHRWGMTDDLYLRMMDMTKTALSLNPENRLVCLLWHQGETDACEHACYDVHYKNLRGLFDSVRDTFGVPTLPVVTADFVHHWRDENADICRPVLDAIRAVCQDIGNGAFVETDGLLSNCQELHRNPLGWEDHIHFSRRACYGLGKRYFESYRQLTGGKS